MQYVPREWGPLRSPLARSGASIACTKILEGLHSGGSTAFGPSSLHKQLKPNGESVIS
jgi:hypothetical protein